MWEASDNRLLVNLKEEIGTVPIPELAVPSFPHINAKLYLICVCKMSKAQAEPSQDGSFLSCDVPFVFQADVFHLPIPLF